MSCGILRAEPPDWRDPATRLRLLSELAVVAPETAMRLEPAALRGAFESLAFRPAPTLNVLGAAPSWGAPPGGNKAWVLPRGNGQPPDSAVRLEADLDALIRAGLTSFGGWEKDLATIQSRTQVDRDQLIARLVRVAPLIYPYRELGETVSEEQARKVVKGLGSDTFATYVLSRDYFDEKLEETLRAATEKLGLGKALPVALAQREEFLKRVDSDLKIQPLHLQRISPEQMMLLGELGVIDRAGLPRPEFGLLPGMRVYLINRPQRKHGEPRYGVVLAGPVTGPQGEHPYVFGVSGLAEADRRDVAKLVQADFGAPRIGIAPAAGSTGNARILEVPRGAMTLRFEGERMDVIETPSEHLPVFAVAAPSEHHQALRDEWLARTASSAGAAAPEKKPDPAIPDQTRVDARYALDVAARINVGGELQYRSFYVASPLLGVVTAYASDHEDGRYFAHHVVPWLAGEWPPEVYERLMALPNDVFQHDDAHLFRDDFARALAKQPPSAMRSRLIAHLRAGRSGEQLRHSPQLVRLWLDDVVKSYETWAQAMDAGFFSELALDERVPLEWHRRYASAAERSERISTLIPHLEGYRYSVSTVKDPSDRARAHAERVAPVVRAWRYPGYVPGFYDECGARLGGLIHRVLHRSPR